MKAVNDTKLELKRK